VLWLCSRGKKQSKLYIQSGQNFNIDIGRAALVWNSGVNIWRIAVKQTVQCGICVPTEHLLWHYFYFFYRARIAQLI
jgi:hypothetical protein